MSSASSASVRPSAAPAKRPAPATLPPTSGSKRDAAPKLRLDGISREGRQLAAALLEVLAGVQTPSAAAQLLGISLPRYYAVELRALQALVAACEPRPKGRQRSPASELAALRRECEQLRRDCARQQALVRAAQRTIGLAPPAPAKPERGTKRRRRKPTARALKAVRVLQADTSATDSTTSASSAPRS
jgi:hypothetical protein